MFISSVPLQHHGEVSSLVHIWSFRRDSDMGLLVGGLAAGQMKRKLCVSFAKNLAISSHVIHLHAGSLIIRHAYHFRLGDKIIPAPAINVFCA